MTSRSTSHCNCRTDIRIARTTEPANCPDCETAFEHSLVEHPNSDHASSTHHGTRTYRGL
ncbi:hypothetical protein CYV19_11875 [Natronobacterium gregoryi SP2]|uniref:C2H2-type domain-containing protein n=1 Tax=Natronobacterium gregoryi (strain ATCC 43098 / DSM 3393 / CCM 3738 / CIP 104747 / IAM 13177 / JCM 8860 / NBRC 102187 / NCIMB 2189 / SP2) TaxID=797304 RepID=A0A2J4JDM1_NATGS|nr:hypothetical protein CYV19_11875 [Natronobacterium gregoryi SP2]